LKAENKLFRVNCEKFLELVVGIQGLLEIPSANFDNLGTEVEPIYLAIQADELEIFIEWMNLG